MSGFLLPEKEEDCMQRIKLMTDSASDLPNELAQQLANRNHSVPHRGRWKRLHGRGGFYPAAVL